MFRFNSSLLRVQYCKLMSVTTALGGAIRIHDEGLPRGERIEVPFAVARAFIKHYKTGKFYVPVDACVVWYGNSVVMIEKRSKYDNLHTENPDVWQSTCEHVINRFLIPLTTTGEGVDRWYTDGLAVYQIPEDAYSLDHETLTADGKFLAVNVRTVQFKDLELSYLIENPATQSCVLFVLDDGKKVLSPPIWNNVLDIRKTIVGAQGTRKFDQMDTHLSVNLEFVLYSADVIGKQFGYLHLTPLQLPDIMIALNTVNLPKVSKAVRETFVVDMQFTTAFAWLLSYCEQSKDLTQYGYVRAAIKQLCTKGTFEDKKTQVLQTYVAPEMISVEQALENAKAQRIVSTLEGEYVEV